MSWLRAFCFTASSSTSYRFYDELIASRSPVLRKSEKKSAQQDERTKRIQNRILDAIGAVGLLAFVAVACEIVVGLHNVVNLYPVRVDHSGPRPNNPQSLLH
jgi:hypothetical protein